MDNYRYPLVKAGSILKPVEKKREGKRIAHQTMGKGKKVAMVASSSLQKLNSVFPSGGKSTFLGESQRSSGWF